MLLLIAYLSLSSVIDVQDCESITESYFLSEVPIVHGALASFFVEPTRLPLFYSSSNYLLEYWLLLTDYSNCSYGFMSTLLSEV